MNTSIVYPLAAAAIDIFYAWCIIFVERESVGTLSSSHTSDISRIDSSFRVCMLVLMCMLLSLYRRASSSPSTYCSREWSAVALQRKRSRTHQNSGSIVEEHPRLALLLSLART